MKNGKTLNSLRQVGDMRHDRVESSSIASVGYDSVTEILEVRFHTGNLYQYFEVPPQIHKELVHANSIGAYFNAHIRPIYAYRQVA